MSKRLLISVILLSIFAGLAIGYVRGMPDDFVGADVAPGRHDYGYRCGDGTEFTIVPTKEMKTITIVPASSVDYVRERELTLTNDGAGAQYAGDGILLRVSTSSLVLDVASHSTTTCISMNPPEESLF